MVSVTASGCAFTEVALVNVQNDTAGTFRVRSRLRGNSSFEDLYDLTPTEQRPLMKYEEGRFTVEPIANLVLGLELVTPEGCVAQLDDGRLQRTAIRDPDARRWTIHVRPEALTSAVCQDRNSVGSGSGGRPAATSD